MEESKSPPSELGLQNCYYSSTRKDAAERAVMADLAHSAEALQDRSLPTGLRYYLQTAGMVYFNSYHNTRTIGSKGWR